MWVYFHENGPNLDIFSSLVKCNFFLTLKSEKHILIKISSLIKIYSHLGLVLGKVLNSELNAF